MPSYRGIEVSLQSQYDALSLPEFDATDVPLRPSPRRGSGFFAYTQSEEPGTPSATEAYAPIYPGSQFWIQFHCVPPVEPKVRYYYFKLLVNGKCILSWGCGPADKYSGRIGFGLYAGEGSDSQGHPIIEKRAFIFPTPDEYDAGGSFEIRVFRAEARRRESRALERWEEGASGNSMKVNVAGYLKPYEPHRMHAYALVDPVDQPYASFVYHHYTSERLREFGLDLPPQFDIQDITKASPSRRAQVNYEPLSPPPKERPVSPPSEHLGKDSIALRKGHFSNAHVVHGSPTKPKRELAQFDALQGLTLASTAGDAQPQPQYAEQKQLLSIPRSASSSGLLRDMAGRWKRRINSRDERNLVVFERSTAEEVDRGNVVACDETVGQEDEVKSVELGYK